MVKKIKLLIQSIFCKEITAHFQNGVLYMVTPFYFKSAYADKDRAYKCRFIISDGIKYDMQDLDSIKSIKIPDYEADAPIGVTGYLEYILKKHIPTGNNALDIEILKKYTILLKYSYWVYPDKEYYRLPKKLYELGEFKKGDKILEIINEYKPELPENPLQRKNLKDFIEENRKVFLGDLVEIQAGYTRCEKCAVYAGRIYSVNGEDKRFPKCPDWIIENGRICDNGCGSAIFPITYYPGTTEIYAYDESFGMVERVKKEPISYSNRPFVDTRDNAEIQRYYRLKGKREEEQIKNTHYMKNYRNFCYEKINNPKTAAKSFSAYMRRLNKSGRYYL